MIVYVSQKQKKNKQQTSHLNKLDTPIIIVQHIDYMSNMAVSYKRQELLTLRKHMSSHSVFDGIRVAHYFSFLCCVAMFFVLVLCLVFPMLPMSMGCQCCQCLWVVNVANVYGLSIPGCPLRFSLTFI